MDQDVLISSQSASTSRVNRKHFTDCRRGSKQNKVALLPKGVHAEWTNMVWLKVKCIVIGVIVGVCVFVVVRVCAACGCGRKKNDASHQMLSTQ
ncbi:hypothetical protein BLNAU_16469 [Blattamonas nauphoetae]|uniref:Uncharacterized protein n=1 Tax=Blattamonas nauphoetae TaxID=2049346 RepID=A0ABQ9XAN8_9EUKA|nr:hypothetical protein BLNAU_17751 [Blattamonas nauphoetae]KAK2948570.1 hypothetical protein BLNAU_16469 [Blattamonas nauphoetae]